MLDSASKLLFHLIARSGTLKKLASRYGLRRGSSFARRFIAGETVDEAIEAARAVEARGMLISLDLLGESVTSLDAAAAATRGYLQVIDAIIASGIERNVSLKLTQLGLDMENSPYTEVTLDIFETLWGHGYQQLGVVLQSMLYRSEQDLARINALGARIRLVKGAYKESTAVAHPKKEDVDAAYARMLKVLLTDGHYPAIATHDPKMIALAREWAQTHGITPDRFEFQMLYGVRRDLQSMLTRAGYRVRIYIPFGREWFPYFMRRLGERPANVMFVIRGILEDRG
jgi:proline dehydrogenase